MTGSPDRAWIWGRRLDLALFGGSAVVALLVGALSSRLSNDGALPSWAWFVFVLGLDVAHVWTTLFRTYLDGEELRRRRALYLGMPLACYAIGVALYSHGALTFWRVLAYVAVFHFVRQQVGWVAIYRAKAGERERVDRFIDDAVVYLATGYPIVYWHAHLPRAFEWFVKRDFVASPWAGRLELPVLVAYVIAALLYVGRTLQTWRRGRAINWGKHVVVASTAAVWLVGIVIWNDDFSFTVTNVTVHAIPYVALLWFYARERATERPASTVARVVRFGVPAFFAVALACAFFEELLWERFIWHDRPGWFGGVTREVPLFGERARMFLVPLLALPQAVHYALDGLIWRRGDTGPAQARALGFEPRVSPG